MLPSFSPGEHDATPRGVFALHRCVVLKEGEKKLRRGKTFHVLALYLHGMCSIRALEFAEHKKYSLSFFVLSYLLS